ncbi:magnesium chelatase, partial [Burkholderia pseudomallei]|nr:magnesium chelatase [Burkholderia pseudomallei]
LAHAWGAALVTPQALERGGGGG